MKKKNDLTLQAIQAWESCAFHNDIADTLINSYLETLCLENGTTYFSDDINLTINNLTNVNKRKLIKKGEEILSHQTIISL